MTSPTSLFVLALLYALLSDVCVYSESPCTELLGCNGHGTCDSITNVCACFDGYGSASDKPATPLKHDCSERVCPMGKAWFDIPTAADQAHAEAECSNQGLCDRTLGTCSCFDGFEGVACQKRSCSPKACNGHGRCVDLSQMAISSVAQPLNTNTAYGSTDTSSTTTWDEGQIYGCICDSSWAVGYNSGETQLASYFGPDCSLLRCPSGNDPMTTADETDCTGLTQHPITRATSAGTGLAGNKCYVECSNRGTCNYNTGVCACFTGYSGTACESQDVLAP